MALVDSFQKNGSWLFKYRGVIPVVIFVLAIPFLFQRGFLIEYAAQNCWVKPTIYAVSILTSLLGLFVRCYTIGTTPRGTSGRNTEKQVAKVLNTKGIYSVVRHPLYLGNYLMWAGILLATLHLPIFVVVSLVYWIYYERIMFTEEAYLESQFGEHFRQWSLRVPPFIPALGQFERSEIPFSFRTVLRREYAGVLAMTLLFTGLDYFTAIQMNYSDCTPDNTFQWCRPSLYILVVILLITLTLRTLKHHTKALDRLEGRD